MFNLGKLTVGAHITCKIDRDWCIQQGYELLCMVYVWLARWQCVSGSTFLDGKTKTYRTSHSPQSSLSTHIM